MQRQKSLKVEAELKNSEEPEQSLVKERIFVNTSWESP